VLAWVENTVVTGATLKRVEMNRCVVDRLVVTDVVPREIIPSAEI
jgi:hypothetical protein